MSKRDLSYLASQKSSKGDAPETKKPLEKATAQNKGEEAKQVRKANPSWMQTRKSKVKSITLYEKEFQIIAEIREILQGKVSGNISDSVIVRIALHTSSRSSENIHKVYKKLLEEDARKK